MAPGGEVLQRRLVEVLANKPPPCPIWADEGQGRGRGLIAIVDGPRVGLVRGGCCWALGGAAGGWATGVGGGAVFPLVPSAWPAIGGPGPWGCPGPSALELLTSRSPLRTSWGGCP